MKFLDLAWQQAQIEPQLSKAISEVLCRGDFINGEAVKIFESAFSEYVGATQCIACGNGTDALELILEGMLIGAGDEVLVPAMTFVATSEAVLRVGATPVLVDVDETATLDFDLAVKALTPRTRAIIAVHLYGYPVDIPALRRKLLSTGRHDVLIIEDAAQAHGATVQESMVGSLGDAAAFSFYPGKNLGALGDAGAVTTSSLPLADRVRRLANHGRLGKYDHTIPGRNSRMDSLQAAVLVTKLSFLDNWLACRRKNSHDYRQKLNHLKWLKLPAVPAHGQHAWHQFAIEVPARETLIAHLQANDIPTGLHYPQSLPELPFHSGASPNDFPRSLTLARNEVSLPIGEHLTPRDVELVIGALQSYQPSP